MTVDEAKNILAGILGRINGSINDDARDALRDEILKFLEEIPGGPEFKGIQNMAVATDRDLSRAINESILKRMREREQELESHAQIISAVTQKAEKDAESLRLKHLLAYTASANQIAGSIQSIRTSLHANNLEDASHQTEQALKLVLNLIGDMSNES